MTTWTGAYSFKGETVVVTVEADVPNDATVAFFGQLPQGAVFVSLAPAPNEVVLAAAAKLVDLGLTPDEVAVVIGPSADTLS